MVNPIPLYPDKRILSRAGLVQIDGSDDRYFMCGELHYATPLTSLTSLLIGSSHRIVGLSPQGERYSAKIQAAF